MTSEISILRKYLSIIHFGKQKKSYRFAVGCYSDSHVYIWGDFCLETHSESYIDVFQIDVFLQHEKAKITDYDDTVILDMIDIQEFLDSDDISLILRYGRNITNNNIIQSLNKNLVHMNYILKLDDFDEFLNLKI